MCISYGLPNIEIVFQNKVWGSPKAVETGIILLIMDIKKNTLKTFSEMYFLLNCKVYFKVNRLATKIFYTLNIL